jgi:hypothetical protein
MNIKNFEVDWDSYDDVSLLGNKIKSRLGNLNPNRISKKEKEAYIFDTCMKIWNIDTLEHYAHLKLDTNKKYYIYCHMNKSWKIRPNFQGVISFIATLNIPYKPFYIGKGTGNRYLNFNRNGYHKKIKDLNGENGDECAAFIIRNNLSEYEALSYEDKLIDILGLKVYGGLLSNLDEGYEPKERRKFYNEHLEKIKELTKNHKIPRNIN